MCLSARIYKEAISRLFIRVVELKEANAMLIRMENHHAPSALALSYARTDKLLS